MQRRHPIVSAAVAAPPRGRDEWRPPLAGHLWRQSSRPVPFLGRPYAWPGSLGWCVADILAVGRRPARPDSAGWRRGRQGAAAARPLGTPGGQRGGRKRHVISRSTCPRVCSRFLGWALWSRARRGPRPRGARRGDLVPSVGFSDGDGRAGQTAHRAIELMYSKSSTGVRARRCLVLGAPRPHDRGECLARPLAASQPLRLRGHMRWDGGACRRYPRPSRPRRWVLLRCAGVVVGRRPDPHAVTSVRGGRGGVGAALRVGVRGPGLTAGACRPAWPGTRRPRGRRPRVHGSARVVARA